jgi:hypothetical protein
MKNYLKKIEDLVTELKTIPNISNLTFKKNTGIREEDFADYADEFSIKIAKVVKDFYTEVDGFSLTWKYNPVTSGSPIQPFEGYINILPFYKMFLGTDDNLWENEIWGNQTPDKDLSFYKNLKIFDYFEKDNIHCVCLEISDGTLTENLWIFREGYLPLQMKIGLEEYIEKLISAKGLWGWQYLFTKADLSLEEFEGIREGIKESITLWSELLAPNVLTKIKTDFNNAIK